MAKEQSKLSFLWRLTRGHRFKFLLALVFLFAASFAALIGPQIIRLFIDSVVGGMTPGLPSMILPWLEAAGGTSMLRRNLWLALIGIVAAGILYMLFQYLYDVTAGDVGESVAKNTRESIYTHLVRLPYDYFVRTPSGDILQRCSSDIGEIQSLLSQDLMSIIGAVITIAVNLAIMIAIDPVLTAVSVALVPFMIILTSITKGVMARAFEKNKSCGDDLASFMHTYVQGIRVIKAFGRQAYENSRFQKLNQSLGDSVRDTEYASAYYWPFYLTLILGQTALVIIVGIFRVAGGLTSVGTVVAFISYSTTTINQFRYFGYILISIAMAQVALGRLDDILGEEQEMPDGEELEKALQGDIDFENVSFSYGERQILRNINLHVAPGETIGILGKAGSGKSTLMQLLVRLYDPTSGRITVDGHDLDTISRQYMRNNVGFVVQEPFLFSRTVADNIAMAQPSAGEDEIRAAAEMASVDQDIQAFRDGYGTVVGERGMTVSGGQRQRIAIAQTLIRNCPILVLDDSLSAVDADTDKRIRSALSRAAANKTIFVISHRINSLAACDRILVMEDGEITACGTHKELAAEEGLYRRIMEIQSADRDMAMEDVEKAHREGGLG